LQNDKMKEINAILSTLESERFNILDVSVLIVNKLGKLEKYGPDLFFSSEYSKKFVEQLMFCKEEDFNFDNTQLETLKMIYLDSKKLKDAEGKLERELNKEPYKVNGAILFCILRGIQEKEFTPSQEDVMSEIKNSFTNIGKIEISTVKTQKDFTGMLSEQSNLLNKKIREVYSGTKKFKLAIKKRIGAILHAQNKLVPILKGYNLHYSGAIQKSILNKSFIEKYAEKKNIWHTEPNMVTSYLFDNLNYTLSPENISHVIFIMDSRNQFCTACRSFFEGHKNIVGFYQRVLKDEDVKKLYPLIRDTREYTESFYQGLDNKIKKINDKLKGFNNEELEETNVIKLSFFGVAGD